ncbi:MAG: TIGR00730 family Rossman fold protein [Holosporaceae bacterium]|nr:MAG: TIGR00730 family Rossman fold protein [Holosporaceae bacterium]
MSIKSIAVYCAASTRLKESYTTLANSTGKEIAKKKKRLVYGGGNTGLMKAVSHSCNEAGGEVLGIITEHLKDLEHINHTADELRIVQDMQARKMQMFLEADAFLILPGGFGTLEEVFEVLTWKQIGLHTKPVVFLNYKNFWDPLFSVIEKMIEEKMTPVKTPQLYEIITHPEDMWAAFKNSNQNPFNMHEK